MDDSTPLLSLHRRAIISSGTGLALESIRTVRPTRFIPRDSPHPSLPVSPRLSLPVSPCPLPPGACAPGKNSIGVTPKDQRRDTRDTGIITIISTIYKAVTKDFHKSSYQRAPLMPHQFYTALLCRAAEATGTKFPESPLSCITLLYLPGGGATIHPWI